MKRSFSPQVHGLAVVVLLLIVASTWRVQAADVGSVTSMTLINALTNAPLAGYDPLIEGSTVDLGSLPTRQLNVRANVVGAVGSVQFLLNDHVVRVENQAPYAMWGDNSGDYYPWIPELGALTIKAVVWSGSNATGTASTAFILHLTFTESATAPISVQQFVLINADTDTPMSGYNPLVDGAVIYLNSLPTTNLNIRADANPSVVGSVAFSLNGGLFNLENTAPYALASDTSGNYKAWTPALGTYTLRATPYQQAQASGAAGTSLVIRFSVVDAPSATQTAQATQTSIAATQTAQATQTNIAATQTTQAQTPTATSTDTPPTQTSVAATQTTQAQTPTATSTDTPPTQTSVAATQTAQATQTSIAATQTAQATSTDTPPTQTNIAATQTAQATQTSIAATQTAQATQTSIAATQTTQATQTSIAATQTSIAATQTAQATQTTSSRVLYLPIVLRNAP